MEIIVNYLESMFSNIPKTEQTKRAKMELLAMMEDKYNELKAEGKSENEAVGTVISEFGNLDELAEDLGINKEDYKKTTSDIQSGRTVTMQTVSEYLSARSKFAKMISIGVMLCIFSVIPSNISEILFMGAPAAVIGIGGLFVLIGIAVMLFIMSSGTVHKYKFMLEEDFNMDYATIDYVTKLQDDFQNKKLLGISFGVLLCIMSTMFVAVVDEVFGEPWDDYSSAVFLLIIGIEVFIFVYVGITSATYNIILKKEEYVRRKSEKTKAESIMDALGGVYWISIVLVYLWCSFSTCRWELTWLIFVIAIAVWGAVRAIVIAVSK